jgi:hypothetical protein
MKRLSKLFLIGLLPLAGCSTPPGVDSAMDKFATASNAANSALTSYDSALAARLTELRRAEALENSNRVRPADDSCDTSAQNCVIILSHPTEEPQPISVTTLIPVHLEAMHQIALYADSLKAITKADAVPEVKAAFDQASAAAVSLAQLAPNPAVAPAVKAFTVAASKAGVWIFGQYQDSIKLNALRDAINQMEPVMKDATEKFANVTLFASLPDKTRLVRVLDERTQAFEDQPSDATLGQMLDAAQKLDAALGAQPGAVFEKMGKAHTQLFEAINGSEISFASALVQIEGVLNEAQKLAAIAKEFEAAANLNTGG